MALHSDAFSLVSLATRALVSLLLYELTFRIDICHVTRYSWYVIKTFADKQTRVLYYTGRSKQFPPDVARRARRKLEYVDLVSRIDDLKVPPGNRLHKLGRDREGQHAIRINDQWRICFRFADGDAYEVEITDYH